MRFKRTFSLACLTLLIGLGMYAGNDLISLSSLNLPFFQDRLQQHFERVIERSDFSFLELNENKVNQPAADIITNCPTIALPLIEDFEKDSKTLNCWSILDQNKDGIPTSNQWQLYNSAAFAYNGLNSYYFLGTATVNIHNDWLVSPPIAMDDSSIYKLSYYYRTHASYNNEIEVALSITGVDPLSFTTILDQKAIYKNGNYKKKTIYITNVKGEARIGWHITSSGSTAVYLDQISLEKVDCIGPNEDIKLSDLGTNQVRFDWQDTVNNQWEVFVKDAGFGAPVGSGVLLNTTNTIITKVNGSGANLQADTEYEFYIRSRCGTNKTSPWIGPILFKTLCTDFSLPFWEGFNLDSKTYSCWSLVDHNGDFAKPLIRNIWQQYGFGQFEGDRGMYFFGNDATTVKSPHDDWMISPTFKLDKSKLYRLRYHYKSSIVDKNDFKLLLSTTGVDLTDFNQILIDKKQHSDANWSEETAIIGNTGGMVNFAWQVSTGSLSSTLYIDNFFLEEVVGCPEPTQLGTKDESENGVTIIWNENFGKDWEYTVQEQVGISPKTGTPTTKKEAIITQDKNGVKLKPNTFYEFYVRTRCLDGSYSAWAGPFVFKTVCGIFSTTPYFENFNTDSKTLNCWTVLDQNKDAISPVGNNLWRPFGGTDFPGSQSMRFFGDAAKVHDDWLISPRLTFKANTVYRFRYKYKTDTNSEANFEVLASNSGIQPSDFKREIVKDAFYKSGVFSEHKSFITGLSGTVNLAWHSSGPGFKIVFIDDVFVEEVVNCPEPLVLGAKDFAINQATIYWTDDFAANQWEYYVQEIGGGTPKGNGTSTTTKENTVTKEQSGGTLKPNTDYEFYVRTVCSNGTFSIWSGPFSFATQCDLYQTPFWESFNSNSKTARCWVSVDSNKDANASSGSWRSMTTNAFEGNAGMGFIGFGNNDDWLISPTIDLDGGMYVLKYHYKTNSEFEVLLSLNGIDTKEFTKNLVSKKTYNNATTFMEEVVFISGVKGKVNIAWHASSKTSTTIYVDNIHLYKVDTCPEPYGVKTSHVGTSSVDVEWKQDGGISNWEVIVVEYGQNATATPTKTLNITGKPEATITGLDPGKGFTIFIRVKCLDGKSFSDWSTPTTIGTIVDQNNNCDGAISIPVNPLDSCEFMASADFNDTKASAKPEPVCGSVALKKDIWFSFVASDKTHILELKNWLNLVDTTVPVLFGSLYDQPCSSINNNALECFNLTATVTKKLFKNLTLGKTYYIRLATTVVSLKAVFNLCITTPKYLEISPSGAKYSVEELVKNVLVNSNCNLVSNVSSQNGDGGPKAMAYNTIGYFNRGKTDFPFEKGIILSTNEVEYAYGPAQATSRDFRGNNDARWVGDKDINDAIKAAGGAPSGTTNKRVTQLEFDFVPIVDSIQFEYLFASNSYYSDCASLGCAAGALFAAWLIDETTGEGQNLAKIKDTELPIALNTILNPIKTGKIQCPSSHPDLYWKHYTPNQDNPFEAYIDFVGLTRVMKSNKVAVVPGRKYHIKLAVIDFCAIVSHSSAVLFNAGSFNLGELNLGEDLTIENQTALCAEQEIILKSGISTSGELKTAISWYKDGVLLNGINTPDLVVSKPGLYKVVVDYTDIDCQRSDEILIEVYPLISSLFQAPKPIAVCRNSFEKQIVNLADVEEEIFLTEDRNFYTVSYHLTAVDAESGDNPISTDYELIGLQNVIIYIRLVDTRIGCHGVLTLPVVLEKGPEPSKREDVTICSRYIFPDLEDRQFYFEKTAGGGREYQVGDVLDVPGQHNVFILQRNTNKGCYEEISYQVHITERVVADVFEDLVLDCKTHQLAPLSVKNKYYTQSGGQGIELAQGTIITQSQKIYVYARSNDGLCTHESSYTVSFNDCPIPKGISPNGDGSNDRFDLSAHGVTSLVIYNRYGAEVFAFQGSYTDQWNGRNQKGNGLPDGTYYYVIVAHGKTRTGWVQINK